MAWYFSDLFGSFRISGARCGILFSFPGAEFQQAFGSAGITPSASQETWA